MPEFRLILHPQRCTKGSYGLEWYERYYLLQTRPDPKPGSMPDPPWQTIPCVLYEDLTQPEKDEIARALGKENWTVPK